jgi:hypothetical protein
MVGKRAEHWPDHPWREDPVAKKTGWTAVNSRGTNMCTHRLKRLSNMRYEFKATAIAYTSSGVYMAIGMCIGGGMVVVGFREDIAGIVCAGAAIGLLFFAFGLFYLRFFLKPCVFDKQDGRFWKDKPTASSHRLDAIHALQIIGNTYDFSRLDDSSGIGYIATTYRSYELNLVFEDGNRSNTVKHGKINILRRDAKSLSKFLGVPLWDMTQKPKEYTLKK